MLKRRALAFDASTRVTGGAIIVTSLQYTTQRLVYLSDTVTEHSVLRHHANVRSPARILRSSE
jgi:hypothetical protein